MSINIKAVAKKATVIAEIMEGRDKGDTQDLIGRKVTINDVEECQLVNEDGEVEIVYAYTVDEFANKFYFAGYVLKKIFSEILSQCGDNLEDMYKAVREQKLKVEFGSKKTKDGKRTVTTITVLD